MREDPLIGRVIDQRYRIDRRLGVGGMGVVYSAHQLRVGRDVAVKVIQAAERLDESTTKRFLREGKMASAIQHPNAVTVFDIGCSEDGLLYMVMELLEGQSLQELLREEERLSVERAIPIASRICQGLEAVHAAGIVHRDLKPANVMLVPHASLSDWVKLLDFGLAKRHVNATEDETVTRAGAVAGTVAYLAPEVIRGDPPDERSDLYALGVVLYEMVAGYRPYQASSAEALLAKALTEEPKALPESVPRVLQEVIGRLLAKEPNERFASAAMVREFLAAASESGDVPLPITRPAHVAAQPAPEPELTDTDPERGQGPAAPSGWRLGVGLILLVLLGLGLYLWGPAASVSSDAEAPRGEGGADTMEAGSAEGQGDLPANTRFDGRYVGTYRSEGGENCTHGQLKMQVSDGRLTGEAWSLQTEAGTNFEVFELVATVERTGVSHGTIRYRGGIVGAFTGRFLKDSASGDSSDSTYGCRGTWEVRRDTGQ